MGEIIPMSCGWGSDSEMLTHPCPQTGRRTVRFSPVCDTYSAMSSTWPGTVAPGCIQGAVLGRAGVCMILKNEQDSVSKEDPQGEILRVKNSRGRRSLRQGNVEICYRGRAVSRMGLAGTESLHSGSSRKGLSHVMAIRSLLRRRRW